MNAFQLDSIFRHIIKGFQPERIESVRLSESGLEWDRRFAFRHANEKLVDLSTVQSQGWLSKRELLNQHDFPQLARLRPHWDDSSRKLTLFRDDKEVVTADILSLEGREKVETWLEDFVSRLQPFEKAYHPERNRLQLIGNAGAAPTFYGDGKVGPVSIATTASLKDLERTFGHAVDPRRFRINLFIDGASPWEELSWSGKSLKIGNAILDVLKPIGRCPNIDVDPLSGDRTNPIFNELKNKLGHSNFGMRANVRVSGVINSKEKVEVL